MLNIVAFIGVIVYVAMNPGSGADDDDKGGSTPTTDDAPTDDTVTVRRLLRW